MSGCYAAEPDSGHMRALWGVRLSTMACRLWGAYLFGTRGAGWPAILVVRLVDEGSAAVRFVRRAGRQTAGWP